MCSATVVLLSNASAVLCNATAVLCNATAVLCNASTVPFPPQTTVVHLTCTSRGRISIEDGSSPPSSPATSHKERHRTGLCAAFCFCLGWLAVRPSVCPYIHVCLFVRLSVCLSVYKCLSVCLSVSVLNICVCGLLKLQIFLYPVKNLCIIHTYIHTYINNCTIVHITCSTQCYVLCM